jgi:hypothetical protein
MAGPQPISVNVVEPHCIGKSSLLKQVCRTYEREVLARGRQGDEFVVVYLSLQTSRCRTVNSFYQTVAEQFLARSVVKRSRQLRSAWERPLRQGNLDGQGFETALDIWKNAKVLPVLCLDKFEELLENPQEFSDDFYDSLRYLAERGALMLVIASTEDLRDYSKRHQLTSDFFNIFQTLHLGCFSPEEAEALARLPLQDPNPAPFWTEEHGKLMLEWGDRHPYLLQLAGSYLWDSQSLTPRARRKIWQRFQQQASGVPGDWHSPRQWRRGIGRVLAPVIWLGKLARGIGSGLDDVGNAVAGMVVLVALGAVVLGVAHWKAVLEFIQQVLGG